MESKPTRPNAEKKKSSILMPFASGKLAEIELSLFSDQLQSAGSPITTYDVGNSAGPDLDQAIRLAAEIAYRIAQKSFTNNKVSFSVGYNLRGLTSETKVVGKSGGLAMAIALYSEILSIPVGRVVATGALNHLDAEGTVSTVEGVEEKVRGALQILKSGDTMFFPLVNASEIPDDLKQQYRERGVKLFAVSSVQEALNFFPGTNITPQPVPETPVKIKRPKLFVVILILIISFALGGRYLLPPDDISITETPVETEESDAGLHSGSATRQDPDKPNNEKKASHLTKGYVFE